MNNLAYTGFNNPSHAERFDLLMCADSRIKELTKEVERLQAELDKAYPAVRWVTGAHAD